jgi:hypothetical protein
MNRANPVYKYWTMKDASLGPGPIRVFYPMSDILMTLDILISGIYFR